MTTHQLHCHPNCKYPHVKQLFVDIERSPGGILTLTYCLAAKMNELKIPAVQKAIAADFLWQHLCFEAFIGQLGKSEYFEFNFSPSRQWAIYGFSEYRVRNAYRTEQTPQIFVSQTDEILQLRTIINLPAAMVDQSLQIGLTAVIEADNGMLSYWALQHTGKNPDFHDRNGLTLTLHPTNPL